MDLYATDYGKRICLACGGRLGKDLRHLEPVPDAYRLANDPAFTSDAAADLAEWGTDSANGHR